MVHVIFYRNALNYVCFYVLQESLISDQRYKLTVPVIILAADYFYAVIPKDVIVFQNGANK